jgi:hypothetical protein
MGMSRKAVVIPDAFAIMALDPGGTSGLAAGVFAPRPSDQPTVKQTLRRAVRKRMIQALVIDGPPERQGHRVARGWRDFTYRCNVELGLPLTDIWFVVEDFNLRQMAVDLAPVEVTAAVRTAQTAPTTSGWHDDVPEGRYVKVSASEAKTFATNDRLKLWTVYDVGRGRGFGDHARDALKHVCLGVNKCLEGRWYEKA